MLSGQRDAQLATIRVTDGRIALYEVMPMHDQIRELVLMGASAAEIKKESMRLGMTTLRRSGHQQARNRESTSLRK